MVAACAACWRSWCPPSCSWRWSPWLGIYFAAAMLIAFFMCAFGQFRLVTALATGVGVALVLFAVFELWFLTPLPKGPLEAALGF